MNNAFVVVGTEGAGTHMLRDFLVAAGCHWRQGDESPTDSYNFKGVEFPFVFHRSVPHAGMIVNLPALIYDLRRHGGEPWILAIFRDSHATEKSISWRDPERDFGGFRFDNYYDQQRLVFTVLGNAAHWSVNWDTLTYEAFVNQEGYRRWLVDRWGLAYPKEFEFYDGNEKYYK